MLGTIISLVIVGLVVNLLLLSSRRMDKKDK